jgi:hypothetical protein
MKMTNEKCKMKNANWKIPDRVPRTRCPPSFFIFHSSFFISQFLFVTAALSAASLAAEPPKLREQSTDDALMQSLDAHSGNDYDRALLGEAEKPKTDPEDRARNELQKNLRQQLGPAAQQESSEEDPLLRAAGDMRDAQSRLAQGKSDVITQTVQRQVVAELQKIIDEAKKSGKCCGQPLSCNSKSLGKAGSGGKSSSSSTPRSPNEAPPRESDPNAGRENKGRAEEEKKLAHKAMILEQFRIALPEREGQKMSAAPSDYFLPEYEKEIEDYFRRLSSGKAAPE